MDKFALNHERMVFTLNQDVADVGHEDGHWERDLQNLRYRQSDTTPLIMNDKQIIDTKINKNLTQTSYSSSHSGVLQEKAFPKHFNDEELDEAYRVYLQQRASEHNAGLDQTILDEDVGILMQEDWLQAQSALKTEITRNRAQFLQTLLLKPQQMSSERIDEISETVELPEFTVNVYALPDMPATRRVKILSEQELLNSLRDKLTPHLTNAVAGMVRQLLQKKLATLSYELQIQLNEETPQVVEEILEYNLDSILRTVKHQLRKE